MKLIYSFISLLFSLSNCTAQIDNDTTIHYQAVTRGSNVTIEVNSNELIYTANIESDNIKLSKKQWNQINELISSIDLETIHTLNAPSSESSSDRALIASLSIQIGNENYKSSTFDHGNPPKELEKIISKIIELAQLN